MSIAHQYGLVKGPIDVSKEAIKGKPKAKGEVDKIVKKAKKDPPPTPSELMEKIAEIETAKAPAPKKGKGGFQQVKKGSGGRPKAESTKEVLAIRLDPELIKKIKAHKNWQKIVLTMLSNQFDNG